MTGGWLLVQLPRAIAEDPVLAGMTGIAEKVGDSIRDDLDALEQHLDIAAASPPMLRYLASWVGADLDPSISTDRQRELLRAIGPLLGWRGTRRGLEGILEALTGSHVRVSDAGGVWTGSQPPPAPDMTVIVELDHLGEFSAAQLRAYVSQEAPVCARVALRIAASGRQQGDPDASG